LDFKHHEWDRDRTENNAFDPDRTTPKRLLNRRPNRRSNSFCTLGHRTRPDHAEHKFQRRSSEDARGRTSTADGTPADRGPTVGTRTAQAQ
jgi:hypothetical protein